jgi:hypothetical protein
MSLSRRTALLLGLCLPGTLAPARAADPAVPVTTRTDPTGLLLQEWFATGRAAGHTGDHYDNRDRGHSALDLSRYPQLKPLPYSEAEKAAGADYGMPQRLRPGTVLGNASLSGQAVNGASIPRLYYSTKEGLSFLTNQYLGNQLYLYPEHQDHDPRAADGTGYGDLYPTNSPYLIISQGSSGTDQPFLNAVAMTMASFTPEVKAVLRERKTLFPVIQQILRSSQKSLTKPEDYLTGPAHPSAFDAASLDEEKMMRLANAMTLETLPPVFHLEVTSESPPPQRGVDFFEGPGRDFESLADRGMVIARVFRGMARERRLSVRVAGVEAGSVGNGENPPVFLWRLLRGDPALVTIAPSESTFDAEITVKYQGEDKPVPGAPALTSRRVEIGVFARTESGYSPPAFITFYFLPNEKRRYDARTENLVEVDYAFDRAFVDVTLTSAKPWRDVYLYDEKTGLLTGWRREEAGKPPVEFDTFGRKRGTTGPSSVLYLNDAATNMLQQLTSE